MKKKNISRVKIDEINKTIWGMRYSLTNSLGKQILKNLSDSENSGYSKGIAYAKLNIAASYFYKSNNENAMRHLTDAFQWFSKNQDESGYAKAILLKGNIYESFGDYEKTLTLWLEAYKVSKKLDDIESEGEACSQLGLIYSRLGDYPKALDYLNKGLKIREQLDDENAMASSLNRIGMVLRQMKKYDNALKYYFRSLEIREKSKQESAIPWTLLGIANTYEDMGMYTESIDFYERAMLKSDDRCVLQALLGTGRIYNLTSEHKNAEVSLTKSLKMAEDLNSHALLAEVYSALATHFEISGQPLKALKSYKNFVEARESYQSNEARSRLSNIEITNAIEKSEQDKEIYRLKHVELKAAYDIIEEKNKDITASINYASRIQRALLPEKKDIRGLNDRCFILFIPKDIVSGDFYWFTKINERIVIAAGDCTGHGVPGALMSMLGISFLEEIVTRRQISESGKILDELRIEIQRALHQSAQEDSTKDGLDISLCIINDKEHSIQYSGAYNDLYLIRNSELQEFRADHMPIGIYEKPNQNFTSHDIKVITGDMIYMFSDGFADQFGGENNKKYKYTSMKAFLSKISKLPVKEQSKQLEEEFYNWKGANGQVDDVLVIGVRMQ